MRAMMWRLKQVHDDDAGILVGTGTANAHVIAATKNVYDTYSTGITLTFKPVATNTSASTLNVNSVGIRVIRKYVLGVDVALTGGEMLIGKPYRLLYDASANSAAGAWLVLNPEPIAGDSPYPTGHLWGMTLSNNASDPTNDIDFSTGSCRNSTDSSNIDLASAITKRIDANWTVGNNQGGLDTGSVAQATYHCFVIKRPDTGVVDALFSLSPTAPTLPANYTLFRRVGSIKRGLSSIGPFTQIGDDFFITSPGLDYSTPNPGTAAITVTLGVPTGIVVQSFIRARVVNSLGTNLTYAIFSALFQTDVAPSQAGAPLGDTAGSLAASASTNTPAVNMPVYTNTSAQIRARLSDTSAGIALHISCYGWRDTRGKQ